MNKHLFCVGATWGHEDRIAGASTSTNVPPPPKYGLRKDHKLVTPGQEQYGPPLRPVCGATDAPNSRFSHFLSRVINDYADCVEGSRECRSSEEMRASFENFNGYSKEIRSKCRILSMDVKALYPSMRWADIVLAVKEMIELSDMEVENVDWREAGKYIAVMVPPEEIEREGLSLVIPKRKKRRTRNITVNYLRTKNNDEKWTVSRKPGVRQKRKMIALIISVGVRLVMSNHTYKVGDEYYLQSEGGAIGLELTGAVSRPFMMRWDKLYLKRVKSAGIKMRMYDRYVDDSNQAAEVLPPGSKYDKIRNKLEFDQDELLVRGEEGEEARLARIMREIANEVQEGIVMEEDYPDKNPNKKLAILDMCVWMNSEHFLVYQHYEKSVASKLVIGAQSAQSEACKRSVHTRELIRRMLNTSAKLVWKDFSAPVLTEYMARMMQAGYSQNYRKRILEQAMRIYDKIVNDDSQGKIPINRPKDWNKQERRKGKRRKKYDWSNKGGYIAPLMVPSTPNSVLMKIMM